MPNRKSLNERSLGKHIGHACEGHFRGIITNLPNVSREQVTRALPFEFPVNPDLVLLNDEEKVRAVFIIAYWDDSKSSEKKFYRTRLEYNEILRAYREAPKFFSADFVVATVIYGAEDGWKEQVLLDIANQCSPLIFLPSLLGAKSASLLIQRAFNVYREVWEAGRANAREAVEEYFAEAELSPVENTLLTSVQNVLGDRTTSRSRGVSHRAKRVVRVPSQSFRTRLRQGLGVLSLFPDEEINAWLQNGQQLANTHCENFARRSFFLDMGQFWEARSLRGTVVHFSLRQAVKLVGGSEVYAPELPDFQDWTRLAPDLIRRILAAHRERTRNPTSVFRGGAYDQIAGNWQVICDQVNDLIPPVLDALEGRSRKSFVDLMCNEEPVTSPAWHPGQGMAWHHTAWAFVVCALAIEQDERGVRGEFDARRQTAPTPQEAGELFSACERHEGVLTLLRELLDFSAALRSAGLFKLTKLGRPRLLSITEPCSWVADFYNTLTTNSSHNPLNEVVHPWLRQKFTGFEWHGWSQRRSCSLQNVLGTNVGRRQWQFIGVDEDAQKFCAAEVKSITQNNWGNKSKELYDRVAEARASALQIGWQDHTVCVLDGDIGNRELEELSSGIGHDEIVSIDTVLDELGDW